MGPLPPPMPHHSSLPPPHAIAAGTRLGRYEVIAELGTGGMATVYLGRALAAAGFQRLVAIKYLHPHLLKDENFVQMFLDEGRLAARIHHPNVVGTLDLVQEPEGIYIVSEYIEGDQLLALFRAARDQNGRIPLGITVRIMLDILAGLHAAHEQTDDLGAPLKLVHRDVSPQNILVGADGISRITDFGIAKAEERIANTRDGIVKGKLSYMAPEQPNDLPIDRRTDIFSAATVLWECLTGRRLFPGKTDGEVLQGLLNKPILHLREVDPEFSTAMDDVLSRALAREMDERFATAADFADALETAATPLGIASPREVARYVKDTAAEKLTEVKERRRAMTTRDLPVFRPSAAPAGTPSGVHAITARPSQEPPAPSAPPPEGDEAPTQVQTSPLAHHDAEHPRPASGGPPPLPKLPPRASRTPLPSLRASRPDTPASATPEVPMPAAAVEPEAPTLAAITPPKELAREPIVPAPLAFAPPPAPARVSVAPTRPSAAPRGGLSAPLIALLVVIVGTLLGVVIYLFTDAPPPAGPVHPPHASQPETHPAAPVAPPVEAAPAPPPVEAAPAPPVVAAPAPARPAAVVRPVAPRPVAPPAPRAAPMAPSAPPVAPPPPPAPAASENDLPTSI